MKKIAVLMLGIMLLFGFVVGCSGDSGESGDAGDAPADEEKRYALILATGGLGDQSFNDLTFEGMKMAEQELGIKFDYVEPKEISDYEIQQSEMAASGMYDLIVTVGFDQADALTKVASEFPEQKFAIIDMVVDLPNVASYVSEEHEGSFLVGALAGLMKLEKADPRLNDENLSGVIGGLDIPLIRKFIAGYEAGIRYVNPDMRIVYDYVGDFSDPATAREMALAMNRRGADIVYHAAGGSGLGVFEAAKSEDFLAVGVNSNQNHIAPDHIFASMLKRVDVATFEAVKSAYEGTFEAGITSLGISDEGVGYSVEGTNVEIPQHIIDKVEELRQKIADGTIVVPTDLPEVEPFLESIQ